MKKHLQHSHNHSLAIFITVALLLALLLSPPASAQKSPRPILYTYYRQMGWGDRIELGYVDTVGDLWALNGHDAKLHWPYDTEEQIQFLADHEFEHIGRMEYEDLFDLKSLVLAAEKDEGAPYSAACDAGTQYTYAVRYDKDGNAEPVLLGMSGDSCFENTDPNAQGLYLAARRLFPNVTCYAGLMGPVGFLPVRIIDFCKLGDLTGSTVKAWYIDCESGPRELALNAKDQSIILDDIQNGIVTGKVSASGITGGYRDFSFWRGDKCIGRISIYNGLLYCSDGMYAIERQH